MDNVNGDYLSSNDKVIHYLQNSTCKLPQNNSLSMLKRSPSTNLYRLRYCSENDSMSSSSSSSIYGSLSHSDFSFESSLSDPVVHCSVNVTNVSSIEDIDFSIGFDQLTDDEDYEEEGYYNFPSLKQSDDFGLRNQQVTNKGFKTLEELLRSSDSMVHKNDRLASNLTRPRKNIKFLNESTNTLCSHDPFSAYSDDSERHQENENMTTYSVRSHSLSIVQLDEKSPLVEKAPKKAVRFADMLGLDLESIRYMSPPDQTTSTMQECVRVRLGQLDMGKARWSTPNINKYPPSDCLLTKKYYLISKHFQSPANIIPKIYERQVMLECLYTKESVAYGTIRVHNFTYHKLVFIRVTQNEWKTFDDISARHSMNYPADQTDTYTFEITVTKVDDELSEPKRILFAICLQALSQHFWDNNQGWNYVLDIFEKR